jgi:hypothetical protein
MTTAHILLDNDIRGKILQNIDGYKYFVARLQNRVYEIIDSKEKHSTYTFLSSPAPIEADFCISFNTTYFKKNMFSERELEHIDRIAERIARAGRKRWPGKKEKETLPLSDPAQKIIQKSTEEDFNTVKDVTDCLVLGTAIALLDGFITIENHHITEAILYKTYKISWDKLVGKTT